MAVRKIKENIFSVGVIDWDRIIFDELIPTPDGTTYNSFIVQGSERTALIDTVDPSMEEEFITNLAQLGIGTIDYIVVNHAEQDHAGCLPLILELFPMATIVTTEKCKDLLIELLLISDERFVTVKDGDSLSLGDKTLQFFHTPWVHWPETMISYLDEDKILFSCDLFGSHYATSELYVGDERAIYVAAKRYYAEIMMPFRSTIQKHLERVEALSLDVIAPSHGPLHRDPSFIVDAYNDWLSDEVKNVVVIPYISMHGSTEKMVKYLTNALIEREISVKPFNMSFADSGKMAEALVDCATIVIASPTVLFSPHPKMVYASFLISKLRPKARCAAVIGSFGWGGKTVKEITGMIDNLNAELLEPVYIKGQPGEEDFGALRRLADEILKKHEDYNIV